MANIIRPSIFAISVVFGGGLGMTFFSVIGLSVGIGLVLGTIAMFVGIVTSLLYQEQKRKNEN